MKINEDNFWLELKNRNTNALEYIIELYSNLVFKIVINILENNREASKECVNDVFLLVWNKSNLYNPNKSSFKNWLLAIAKYKSIDYKRKSEKHSFNTSLEDIPIPSKEDIEDNYILKEKKEELLKLLETENTICKEIFIRKYILYESTDSIAKSLKLSKGAVYNRLWRTRNSIIKKLNLSENLEVVK
ncbi:sigma-70 family RNA polymerase sigma factor [Clostridium felsineum]|uniref:Uncharacterized protein n=1 Tax=Clostridium felsineum TaxID=36839 RepID=A0A1S8LWV2_9CLOT|nr:sigma-70 family RNA polymerase sigma factor [Clostridium felsineum]URZ08390.1 hypothetical protein CLROS_037720 [Clostridium felsineum]URZ13421.1 hypothetical protein CROST_041870 [Clostridium felsineum]